MCFFYMNTTANRSESCRICSNKIKKLNMNIENIVNKETYS